MRTAKRESMNKRTYGGIISIENKIKVF